MRHAPARATLLVLGGLALVVAATSGAAPVKGDARVVVIVSQDAPQYLDALEGVKSHLESQGARFPVDVHALHGDAAAAAGILQGARRDGAGLVVTLGSLATQAAVREVRDLPIVAGLLLNADDLAKAPNATGVVLEFPVEVELQYMKKLLPGQRNVGVLFNPAENQARIDAATRIAGGLGLTIYARKVEAPKDLPDALDSLNRRADVLWGVADQVVLNPQTVKPILLFSLRNRIPFVGLSETWVKAGAVYALDRDYKDIGRQCGEMVLKILQGTSPAALPPVPPRKVLYSVNLKTARMLKLDLGGPVLQAAQTVIE
jgi:putative ABC transport system substrate-binding protein